MVWISSLILLGVAVVSYFSTRDFFSNATIFSLFWLLIVIGTSFHIYDLEEVDEYVYYMVLSGTFFFSLAAVLFRHYIYILTRKYITEKKFKENYVWKNKFGIILLIAAIIIIIIKIYFMMDVLITSGIGAARYSADITIKLTGWAEIIELYFAKPYLRAFLILFTIHTFKDEINVKKMLIIIFLTTLSYLEDGGRSVILFELFSLLYLYKLYDKNISSQCLIYMKGFIVLIIGLFIYATIERGSSVFVSFYNYYCGSLVYLSNIITSNLYGEYTYGVTSFQGFLRPVFGFLNLVDIQDPPLLVEADRFLLGAQYYVVWITPNDIMNYFVTCFGYFYKDMGAIGIVIFSSVYGAICGSVDGLMLNNKENIYSLSAKILTIQGIVFSMSIFCFASFNYVMTFVYIFIVAYSSRKVNNLGVKY